MVFYHDLYTLILGPLMSSIIILIRIFSIWLNLKKQNQRRNDHAKHAQRDQQVIIILLSLVVVFIKSAVPFMNTKFFSSITHMRFRLNPADRHTIESFVEVITEVFLHMFRALTFYSIHSNSQIISLKILPTKQSTLTKSSKTILDCPTARPLQSIRCRSETFDIGQRMR